MGYGVRVGQGFGGFLDLHEKVFFLAKMPGGCLTPRRSSFKLFHHGSFLLSIPLLESQYSLQIWLGTVLFKRITFESQTELKGQGEHKIK
jgi:hypothetical protein